MTPKRLYFVAGEASGDEHGAALLAGLSKVRPGLQFVGRGGPKMKVRAGAVFEDWISDAAVVGLWEVLRKYPYFRRKFRETLEQIEAQQPDAVVLIDYPGFNLRLARALRQRRPSVKIIYYISPQVWAWNRGRIKRMSRWLDLMLCIFPFEAELYNASGLRTIFVGHPMIERLGAQKTEVLRDPGLVALFPGSRRREVRKIFPIMIKTAAELLQIEPRLSFEIAASSPELAVEIQRQLSLARQLRERFEVRTGDAAQIMQSASAGIIASGTATQEAAFYRLPFVLVYKVSWATYLAARLVIKVDYLGMLNVIANRQIVPEFIQHKARPKQIARAVLRLLNEPSARQTMVSAFDEIISSLGEVGASDRAARAILAELPAAR